MKDSEIEALAEESRSGKPWKTLMIASFVMALLGPLLGLAGTVFGMVKAFEELETRGGADPAELAERISHASSTTVIGIGLSAAGIACGVVFLVLWRKEKKARWSSPSGMNR